MTTFLKLSAKAAALVVIVPLTAIVRRLVRTLERLA
jgi:hypothetical protein